jgi:hypothetical protein
MSASESFAEQQLMWMARTIAAHGIAVISVGYGGCSCPGCPGEPSPFPWTYTVGMVEIDHPELVLFGLTPTEAARRLNWVHDRAVEHEALMPGELGRLGSTRLRLDRVPDSWANDRYEDPMGQWFHHYDAGRPVLLAPPVLQLVWSDRRGRFPDEPGCDPKVRRSQPLLARGGEQLRA